MKYNLLIMAVSFFCLQNVSAQKKPTAIAIINNSIQAMGKGWDTVTTLRLEGYGNTLTVDQSERSEGPYIPGQEFRTTVRHLPSNTMQVSSSSMRHVFNSSAKFLMDETSMAIKGRTQIRAILPDHDLHDDMFAAPEVVLHKAQLSGNSVYEKDTLFQQAKHYVIKFTYQEHPVRVFINQETNLLTAVEIVKPSPGGYDRVFGDAKKIVLYSFWCFLGDNIHYPIQRDTYYNGWYLGSYVVNKWTVNPPVLIDTLRIPDSVKSKAITQLDIDNSNKKNLNEKAKQIAEGIWLLPGPCNTTVVEQEDGIVVIESSYSSSYGAAIMEKVKQLFPAKKIKALIATSDAWLHLGGIRPFATLNIPIYHPYRNKPLIEKILTATYITDPDLLAKQGKGKYQLIGIDKVTTIGKGQNKIQLYPYCTETGDRMMMAFFPEHQLLYTSDLYQPKDKNGKYWNPHYSWEVYHAIQEYNIPVKQFYAMHVADLLPYSSLQADFPNN